MRRRNNWLPISILALALVLISCKTTSPSVELVIPTLEAFRPPLMPEGLIPEPQTAEEILHNSVLFEFWAYDWQDYAMALEAQIEGIRVDVKQPP